MIQILKIEREYMKDVRKGIKKAELRLNDRNFQAGQFIRFNIKVPDSENYVLDEALYKITHVLDASFGLKENYVILSIKKLPKECW